MGVWGSFKRVPERVGCFLQGLQDYLIECSSRLLLLLGLKDFNLLDGAPVRCLASASHWESEMVQA